MTIEDFLRLLLRNVLLLVAMTMLGGAAGMAFSYTKPEVYASSALGYVSANSQTDESGNPIAQASGNMELQYSKAQSYLPLFSTRAVGERIVEAQGLDASPDEVAGSLQTTLDPNAPIITVTATAADPATASEIANSAVEATAEEARTLETGGDESVGVSVQLVPYQNALVPGAPVSPDRLKYLAVGLVAGAMLGLAGAWMRDRNDTRIRTVEDVTRAVDVPLLGTLPETKELARTKDGVLPDPSGFAPREAIRKLRTNLRYVDVDDPPRSIVVTSSAPGEGKSTVAANLARVMARAGHPTVLVDADLRRPMVAEEFEVDGAVGLSQLLASSVSLEDTLQPTAVSLLSVLPAGQVPPNPSELLGSQRMKELLDELSRRNFVILDAPPVLAVTDAQLLARHADGAILVVVPGLTRSVPLNRSVEAVRAIGAKVFGVVINRASSSRLTRLAYGDTEYGYGYGKAGYSSTSYGAAVVPAETEAVDVTSAGGPADAPAEVASVSTMGGHRARVRRPGPDSGSAAGQGSEEGPDPKQGQR